MTVGENIKAIRKEKGITQKRLGELCGIAESNIRKYENGKQNPKIETIQKIATALNVSLGELMDIDYIVKQNQEILDNFGNHPENWIFENPLTGIRMPFKQSELLKHYNSLNESGKAKAIERVEELTEIPRYTKKEE